MRLRTICLLTITFIIFASYQLTYGQFTFMGANVGMNLSRLDYKSDLQGYDFNYRYGIKSGLFVEYKFANTVFLETEINYSMRGTEYGADEKVIGGIVSPKHKFIQELNYVEIPILLHYEFLTGHRITPGVFVGPELSLLLNAKIEYVENDVSRSESDQKDSIEPTEYGVVLGIRIDFDIMPGKVVFDTRYNYGLSNINKQQQGSEIKSNTISVNLGYAFSL